MSTIIPLWPLVKPHMVGKNFGVSTGFLAIAGTNCYQVPASLGVHTGWDVNGPEAGDGDFGEPIQAILSGTVAYAGFFAGFGNVVVVELDDKSAAWGFRIAHMPHLVVKVGQKVTRGQIIGQIGKGPNGVYVAHLHIDLWAHDMGKADRWNGGLKGSAAIAFVKTMYVSPKTFYAHYGVTNIQHLGGCPL